MDYTYLWALGCFVGIVILAYGLSKKSVGPLSAPLAVGVGAILAIAGFAFGLGPILGWDPTAEDVTIFQDAPLTTPAFTVTASNGSYDPGTENVCTQTVNDAKDGTVVQIMVDLSLDTFQANYTSFNFTIQPIPPTGADSTDLATIFFSVDEGTKYGGEEIFYETSNVMQAIWSIDDSETTANYEGSSVMTMDATEWVELRCILDGKGTNTFGEEFDSVGDMMSFDIEFWNNDKSWTWDYTVTLMCVRATA